jgi:hypothetical protein
MNRSPREIITTNFIENRLRGPLETAGGGANPGEGTSLGSLRPESLDPDRFEWPGTFYEGKGLTFLFTLCNLPNQILWEISVAVHARTHETAYSTAERVNGPFIALVL